MLHLCHVGSTKNGFLDRALSVIVASALLTAAGIAQSRPRIVSTIDARVEQAPVTVTVDGRLQLVYELHITNFRSSDVTLRRIEIVDTDRDAVIGDFAEEALTARLTRPGAPRDLTAKRILAGGLRAVVFVWLPVDSPPARLTHRITLDAVRDGTPMSVVVTPAAVDVRHETAIVLAPPLRGGPWVALYDPMLMGGHRTAMYAVQGRAGIPSRFAIDFVKLGEDGSPARGERSLIANWHGYGAEVLAVADAIVIEAHDDISESPSVAAAQGTVPLENVSGNFVSLDLGGGRYAFYEHLKHGSVRVKPGDRVKGGDVIGQLGNSGSSSAGPHLHFHVADARAELAAEGLPYVFASFDALGAFESISGFTSGERWRPADAKNRRRQRELPSPNAVLVFSADAGNGLVGRSAVRR